jgi:hypothetical protein
VDTASEIRLQAIMPALATKLRLVDAEFQRQTAELYGEPDPLEIVQGLRSWNEQLKLWLIGRDQNGNVIDDKIIVTKAPPGHSWHEFGMATDEVPRSLLVIKGWVPESPLWPMLRKIEESYGLTSGACWHRPDLPHAQMTGRFGVSPDDEVRQLFKDGGMGAVWAESGANS